MISTFFNDNVSPIFPLTGWIMTIITAAEEADAMTARMVGCHAAPFTLV